MGGRRGRPPPLGQGGMARGGRGGGGEAGRESGLGPPRSAVFMAAPQDPPLVQPHHAARWAFPRPPPPSHRAEVPATHDEDSGLVFRPLRRRLALVPIGRMRPPPPHPAHVPPPPPACPPHPSGTVIGSGGGALGLSGFHRVAGAVGRGANFFCGVMWRVLAKRGGGAPARSQRPLSRLWARIPTPKGGEGGARGGQGRSGPCRGGPGASTTPASAHHAASWADGRRPRAALDRSLRAIGGPPTPPQKLVAASSPPQFLLSHPPTAPTPARSLAPPHLASAPSPSPPHPTRAARLALPLNLACDTASGAGGLAAGPHQAGKRHGHRAWAAPRRGPCELALHRPTAPPPRAHKHVTAPPRPASQHDADLRPLPRDRRAAARRGGQRARQLRRW